MCMAVIGEFSFDGSRGVKVRKSPVMSADGGIDEEAEGGEEKGIGKVCTCSNAGSEYTKTSCDSVNATSAYEAFRPTI